MWSIQTFFKESRSCTMTGWRRKRWWSFIRFFWMYTSGLFPTRWSFHFWSCGTWLPDGAVASRNSVRSRWRSVWSRRRKTALNMSFSMSYENEIGVKINKRTQDRCNGRQFRIWLSRRSVSPPMYYNLYLKPILIHSAIVIKHNILMRLCVIS